jgi:predicted amidophosphoribosyltransferase
MSKCEEYKEEEEVSFEEEFLLCEECKDPFYSKDGLCNECKERVEKEESKPIFKREGVKKENDRF